MLAYLLVYVRLGKKAVRNIFKMCLFMPLYVLLFYYIVNGGKKIVFKLLVDSFVQGPPPSVSQTLNL